MGGNPDLLGGTGMAVVHYLQSVTPKLSVGAELAYQAAPQIPGGHIGVLSGVARYAGSDFSMAGSISNAGSINATYFQKCSADLSVGAELETNLRMGQSKGTIGYKVDIPRAGLTFKGCVDSDWEVKAVLEKKLLPIPFTFRSQIFYLSVNIFNILFQLVWHPEPPKAGLKTRRGVD